MERGVPEARAVPPPLLHLISQESGLHRKLAVHALWEGGVVVVSLQACSGMFPEGQSILLYIWLQNEMVVPFFFFLKKTN